MALGWQGHVSISNFNGNEVFVGWGLVGEGDLGEGCRLWFSGEEFPSLLCRVSPRQGLWLCHVSDVRHNKYANRPIENCISLTLVEGCLLQTENNFPESFSSLGNPSPNMNSNLSTLQDVFEQFKVFIYVRVLEVGEVHPPATPQSSEMRTLIVQDLSGYGMKVAVWPQNSRNELLQVDGCIAILGAVAKHKYNIITVGFDAVLLPDRQHVLSSCLEEVNLFCYAKPFSADSLHMKRNAA